MKVNLIVAVDLDGCIGRDDNIPWHVRSDLNRFRELTTGCYCVVGKITHDSIVARIGKPLPNRRSLVVSRSVSGVFDGGRYYPSPKEALDSAMRENAGNVDAQIFIIGGAQIYRALLPRVERILITTVHTRCGGNIFMPQNWLGGFMQTEASATMKWDPQDEFESSYTTYERYQDNG